VDAERPREVTLDGRAFFAVARMPDRPFRVHAGDATADVLGTRFELATDSGRVQLRVVEGRVALGTDINTVEVGAGEESGVRSGTALLPTRPEGGTEAPAWLGAFLVFQATPLRDAAGEIERAFDVRVLLEDEALAGATLTSSFTDQPLEGVIDVVCAVLDARCGIHDGVVSIGR
jgi:ferric-dicitrate binding protein FerR (iron transport regulator)